MRPGRDGVWLVRPYGERIRGRVVRVLTEAGLDVRGVVAAGTSDEEALTVLLRSGARRFVIPFHAHRDTQGASTDGLTLSREVVERVEDARILMPVSAFGAAATSIATAAGVLPSGVLLLPEEELDGSGVVDRVREHLGGR